TDPDPIVTETNVVFNSASNFTGDSVTHDPAVNTVDVFVPAVGITKTVDHITDQNGNTIAGDTTAATAGGPTHHKHTNTNHTNRKNPSATHTHSLPNLILDSTTNASSADPVVTNETLLGRSALVTASTNAGLDNLAPGESGSFMLSHSVTSGDF